MIKVTIGTNMDRVEVMTTKTAVVKNLLEENNVDYTIGSIHFDGVALSAGDLNKTLEELGAKDSCYLIVVLKSDCAL